MGTTDPRPSAGVPRNVKAPGIKPLFELTASWPAVLVLRFSDRFGNLRRD